MRAVVMEWQRAARFSENRAAFIGDTQGGAGSIDDYVIYCTQTPLVRVIDLYAGAGFDRGSDHFALLVHNVTRPVENIGAGSILVNDESFGWLVNRRRPVLSRGNERSRNRYWFCSCLFFMRRVRLSKRQWRNQQTNENDNCFFHDASFFDE
jgi:hypothetical protein